ncbi:MAG: glutaredoxin family protein [Acidiferrobacteraceae bacterium]
MKQFVLYGREGCHLCEEMRRALETLRGQGEFMIEERDISGDPVLEAAYGEIIPVLEHDGVEISRIRLDREALRRYLQA